MFIEVAINIPSNRTFTYSVPDESRVDVAPGKRVLVPFGKRSLTGYILAVRRSTDRKDTRDIVRVLDREPLFHEGDLRFYRWAADYYFTPLGRALGEILPGGIDIESLLWAVKCGDSGDLTPDSGEPGDGAVVLGGLHLGRALGSVRGHAHASDAGFAG